MILSFLSFRRLLAVFFTLGLASAAFAQTSIPITNAGFDTGFGSFPGALNNTIGIPITPQFPAMIGTSNWYGQAAAINIGLSYRPGLAVTQSNPLPPMGYGELDFQLGPINPVFNTSDIPEADLWQTLSGQTLLPGTTYALAFDIDAGVPLTATDFANAGFGIAISTGSSIATPGTFFDDSIDDPSDLTIVSLGGTALRVTLTFNTGISFIPDPGIVVFGGYGTQLMADSLLHNYQIDNASLDSVPEPSTWVLLGGGMGLLVLRRRRG